MFHCRRCGWCCKHIVINVAYSDILRWFHGGRFDILREVSYIDNYPKKGLGGFYVAKTAFKPKQACPFLTKQNLCGIHETKPRACRDFPYGHQRIVECPAWGDVKYTATPRDVKAMRRDFKRAYDERHNIHRLLMEARR